MGNPEFSKRLEPQIVTFFYLYHQIVQSSEKMPFCEAIEWEPLPGVISK